MGRKRNTNTTSNDTAPLALVPVEETVDPLPMPTSESFSVCSSWRVRKTMRVSWFGHVTTMPAGKIVSLASCGPDGIARLREQGVELEPMV